MNNELFRKVPTNEKGIIQSGCKSRLRDSQCHCKLKEFNSFTSSLTELRDWFKSEGGNSYCNGKHWCLLEACL